MSIELCSIPLQEVLHFLGWRGTPVDEPTLTAISEMTDLALREIEPRVAYIRKKILSGFALEGTAMIPAGRSVQEMLSPCDEAILIAGTLGVQSERLLLRMQAQDAAKALLLDAVLSAGIEALMDAQEDALRSQLEAEGLYLTDRFSPGYGDMPLAQSREICEVLGAQRCIGLTVSQSGILIPRKSVTAVMGVSGVPVKRRPKGCEGCGHRETCALSRTQSKGRN